MERCEACGFDPAAMTFEQAVTFVEDAPDAWVAVMPTAVSTQPWSPVAYLWHVVDVLRFGAERFWSLTLDPTAPLPPWDADEVAAARSYGEQSVAVGIQCLRAAANVWAGAALSCPPDVLAPHAELGSVGRDDFVVRNVHEVVHHLWDVTPR
jgi:hypothetical protein